MASKRPRSGANVNDLGRRSHVSQSGIATLLNDVRMHGMPEHSSRNYQYKERKRFASTMTPFGTLIVSERMHLENGAVHTIAVQNPMAILHQSMVECEGFRCLIRDAIAEHGVGQPWHLIVYNDGISPQDSKSAHDKRKLVSFYWAFKEYGQRALSTEEAWGVLATVRLSLLEKYKGGLSRFTREFLDKQFFNKTAGGNDFETTGMALPQCMSAPAGNRLTLNACLWCFVADEPALKDFFMIKGHAGLLPCILCSNVLLHRLYDPTVHAGFISTACTDWMAMKRHTDASIRVLYLHLAEQHGLAEPDDFKELELACGMNYSVFSLMAEPRIMVASMLMYDWPHTYVIGGLLDNEMGSLMQEFRRLRAPTSYDTLSAIVGRFTFPGRQRPNFDRLFDAAAVRSHYAAGAFKSSASDFLTLAPIFAFYMKHVALPQGHAQPMVVSMIAGFDVLSLLLCIRHGCVEPEVLKGAIEHHLRLFKAAYGPDAFVPKHHYAMHLWWMLYIFGMLLSSLPLERLHKIPKRYTRERRNTQSYEVGTIEDITIKQLYDRRENWLAVNVLVGGGSPPFKKMRDILQELYPTASNFLVARAFKTRSGPVVCEDVVFFLHGGARQCGQVKLHCSVDGSLISFIECWELAPVAFLDTDIARYKICPNPHAYPSKDILTTLVYSAADGFATVLVPPLLR